jgi:hypothetical protein
LGNAAVPQHLVPKFHRFEGNQPLRYQPNILMHDGSPAGYRQNTVNSVKRIITFYKSRG